MEGTPQLAPLQDTLAEVSLLKGLVGRDEEVSEGGLEGQGLFQNPFDATPNSINCEGWEVYLAFAPI